jgi:hypothetical protein
MSPEDAAEFKLTLLSPAGPDGEQYFEAPLDPDSPAHPPVNFHGLAACTGGSFHRDARLALADKNPVLLLLRGNFRATQRALELLKENGRVVAVSLKETGLHQIAQQLDNVGRLSRFWTVVNSADGCIAATPEAAEIFRLARREKDEDTVVFIPTPYPLEDRRWNMSIPPDQQAGILIGTREWDIPSRNHAAALLLARQLSDETGEPVTVFNFDGRKPRKLLGDLGFPAGKLRIIEEEKSLADYVREVAKHKIVLQLDRSRVPGQVAGDALLARTVCVGGDGTVERIAFPSFCGFGRTFEQLGKIALPLLKDTNARATAILESQWRAMERLSFSATRKQLKIFYERIGSR